MTMSGFDHRVMWREFTTVKERPAKKQVDAKIIIRTQNFRFKFRQEKGENCRVTNVSVSIMVNIGQSWVVRGHESAALLQHEQGHYDITALGIRDLHNQVLAVTAARCSNIDSEVNRLQKQMQTRIDKTNRRYDTQTNHGNNAKAQSRWDTRIRSAKNNSSGTLDMLPRWTGTD